MLIGLDGAKSASVRGWEARDIVQVACKISGFQPRLKDRLVVITQGPDPIIVARNGKIVKSYKVPKVEIVVDTTGAGDSFVGGFLSRLVYGEELDSCINAGIQAAQKVVQIKGCCLNGMDPPSNNC